MVTALSGSFPIFPRKSSGKLYEKKAIMFGVPENWNRHFGFRWFVEGYPATQATQP
jgi:hypothetical protein